MKRKIAVVSTSRADYGHLYWPLKDLSVRPDIELTIIATAAHLSPEFGHTIDEMERDGFRGVKRVECLMSSDSDVGMAKTIGLATLGFADLLSTVRPDILLLIADRYELLAPASVALALRIPVAHIEGGEISEGAIDDAVRNALTKLSHIHFTATDNSRLRVLAMGEESWRVHRAGAPSLDHLRRRTLFSRRELEDDLGIDLDQPTIVVAYHPVTIARDTTREAAALFEALGRLREQIVFCFPNADAGSRELISRAEAFCESNSRARVFVNLNHLRYWSLLNNVQLMLGNSSSGIMETASLRLPSVNIGLRQKGRERPRNVIDAEPETQSILAAVAEASSTGFRDSLDGMINPYGDGHASERIIEVLASVGLGEELLTKRAVPLRSGWAPE
ncbi:MAG TPA: UDP-N-acetylglucosamine 2-epimerase [Blastocatellia bacterium]|nr:UDP-N-acetylglucosamine 2-epimerase [Blastocatellia bacterium]